MEPDKGIYDSIFEAKEALISLGFNPKEIQLVLADDSIDSDDSVENIIKECLKKLSK